MSFPETFLIDAFNRSDENPLAGGIWSPTRTYSPDGSTAQLQTNQARQAAFLSSSHTIQSYPEDQECWATIAALANSDDVELNGRIRDPNIAGAFDFYQWVWFVASSSWRIIRVENGVAIGIGPNPTTPDLAAGDSIGMRLVGATIEGWHKPAAGSWTLLVSYTDPTPLIHPGFIGIGMNDSDQAWRIDDFGGGSPSRSNTIFRIGRGSAW